MSDRAFCLRIVAVGILATLLLFIAPNLHGQQVREVRIRLRDGTRMRQLDPLVLTGAQDTFVGMQVFNGLVRLKPGTPEVEPELAERWEISRDGLTITFFLRRGVKWQKGYGEVTADDVKFTFDRHLNPASPSPFAAQLGVIRAVEARDQRTVVFRLSERNVAILDQLAINAGFIVPKRAVEELGKDFALKPVGAGPFVFEAVSPAGEVTLLANRDYFRGAPRTSRLVFVPVREETVVAGALLRGDLHFAFLFESGWQKTIRNRPEVNIVIAPSDAHRSLWLNTKKAPLDNKLVRQAIAHAVNKKAISEAVFEGINPPLETFLPPTVWASTTEGIRTYPFNVARARELLRDGGYRGERIRLLYSARPVDEPMAEAVLAMLTAAGLNVELVGLEHAAYVAAWRDRPMEFHILLRHFARTTDPDSVLSGDMHSDAIPPKGGNFAHYEAVDGLIDAGRRELDQSLRRRIYVEIQKRIAEDVPVVPVINTSQVIVHRTDLRGYIPGPSLIDIRFYPLSWTR